MCSPQILLLVSCGLCSRSLLVFRKIDFAEILENFLTAGH